jgi:DHA1 family tetracycline resistance protein-like MFS transporter
MGDKIAPLMPSPPPPGARRAAVAFILITITLDILALGMIAPVLPQLVKEFEGGDTAAAARMIGIFGSVWATMQFLVSPTLGAFSDHIGRRRIVLLSNFGLGLDYIFMALAPSLGWLFVGRLISGMTAASIPTAFAYIADVTPPDKRAKSYGLIGAAFGIGFIFGPVVGGVLGHYGPRLPFWFAAGLSLTNAMYGLFVLPESLPPDRRSALDWRRANPVGSLSLLRRHPQLIGFASVHFLYFMAQQSLQTVFVLYAGYRYGWDERAVGLCLGVVGVSVALVQGALVGRVVHRFGERRAIITGLTLGAAGFVMYGLAPTGAWFVASVPVMSFFGLYGPSAQSLMTRLVSPSEQGKLQGALTSVTSITGIVGPSIFSFAFAAFIGSLRGWHLPGAPFVLAGSCLLTAMLISERITRRVAVRAVA